MEENLTTKKPVFKPALQSGIIFGMILIVISIITYFAGIMTANYLQWVMLLIMVGAIFFFARKYRIEVMGGYISYGRALGFSTLLMVFAGVISAIYTFIFYKFIDPSMIQRLVELSEERMYSQGLPDDQIEMASVMMKKIMTPVYLGIIGFFNTIFFGFIISLIVSLFVMKKDKNQIA